MFNRLFGVTQQSQPITFDQQDAPTNVVIDIEAGSSADNVATDTGRHLLEVDAKEIDTNLWRAFSEAPRPLFEEFKKAFIEGVALQLLTSLSEDTLKKYGCTPTQIKQVTVAIDMLFALYSGSLLSSSAENVTWYAMKYFEYSDERALLTSKIASTTVSIAQNLSPLGIAKVAVASGAGYAGSKLTLWSKEKISEGIASLTKSKEPEPRLTQVLVV